MGTSVEFDEFVELIGPRLRQALIGALGYERGDDGYASALAYAWEHRERVMAMESPIGYLFKVGRTRSRSRRRPTPLFLAPIEDPPEYEPRLAPALAALPEKQRVAVFLVTACGWSKADVARLTGRAESTVGTHVERGLDRLRRSLGVEER